MKRSVEMVLKWLFKVMIQVILIFSRFEREGYDDLDFECTEKGFANFHVKIDLVSLYL